MSRADSGWEYGEWGVRWAPTTESAISELTYDKYGQEYEELKAKLLDIARAAQRDAAELLKEAGHTEAAALIFPDYPQED
ncbi:hypothetical protein SEA_HANK144_67 [Streptomyces phage Hank144]|uniref:Uncharacterized protein n=1 Tax=Streptomyces phage Hank144 TaxID=2301573 RepID=A0A385DNZ0_9CAUD|nr:hypothetical protein KGG76_gp67 [Streptomyces phage Hank144]AXQ61120.1 hypothetical protein SEA_HANK144_67 [Streptomyces phage Hank144]